MEYQGKLTVGHPGVILLMVDQSSSMEGGVPSKAESAAEAVNGMLYEVIAANDRGNSIADKCHIFALGYGGHVTPLLNGRPSELLKTPLRMQTVRRPQQGANGQVVDVELQMPVWLEPTAQYDTPMAEAFTQASTLLETWVTAHPDHFPPIVINITDGEPNNREAARRAAMDLRQLRTTDGAALLFNIHISANGQGEVVLPATPDGLDSYGRFLFEISSELPPLFLDAAQDAGLPAVPGSRGCVFNGTPETLIKVLNFGSSHLREPRHP